MGDYSLPLGLLCDLSGPIQGDVLQRMNVGSALRWQRVQIAIQTEDAVDKLILRPNIALPQPSNLPFPNLVNCLVALDRSSCAVETTEMLLGTNPFLDGSVVLLEDVVQVRDRPMSAAPP